MGIKKSATFTTLEFAEAEIVAAYKHHSFARFIVHCVNKETQRYLKDAIMSKDHMEGIRALAVGGLLAILLTVGLLAKLWGCMFK